MVQSAKGMKKTVMDASNRQLRTRFNQWFMMVMIRKKKEDKSLKLFTHYCNVMKRLAFNKYKRQTEHAN